MFWDRRLHKNRGQNISLSVPLVQTVFILYRVCRYCGRTLNRTRRSPKCYFPGLRNNERRRGDHQTVLTFIRCWGGSSWYRAEFAPTLQTPQFTVVKRFAGHKQNTKRKRISIRKSVSNHGGMLAAERCQPNNFADFTRSGFLDQSEFQPWIFLYYRPNTEQLAEIKNVRT